MAPKSCASRNRSASPRRQDAPSCCVSPRPPLTGCTAWPIRMGWRAWEAAGNAGIACSVALSPGDRNKGHPGLATQLAQMRDQAGGRSVQLAGIRVRLRDDRREARSEFLAELDAPLIERIDVPDRRLDKHLVLIDRDEAAEHARVELRIEQRARGAAAGEGLMRREARRLFGALPMRLHDSDRL